MENASNSDRHTYLSLSTGFFLKFYKDRKPLKRTKLFKILLIKLVSKILTLAKIRYLSFIINGLPLNFLELQKILTEKPIIPSKSAELGPLYNLSSLEINSNPIEIVGYLFLKTKSFGSPKLPRKGRVKRKVLKRLLKKNKVQD